MDEKPAAPAQQGETCLCRDALRRVESLFWMPSDEARRHLRNARIEVLKAFRTVIDERISRLSRTNEQQGTKLTVE